MRKRKIIATTILGATCVGAVLVSVFVPGGIVLVIGGVVAVASVVASELVKEEIEEKPTEPTKPRQTSEGSQTTPTLEKDYSAISSKKVKSDVKKSLTPRRKPRP